MVTKEQLGVGYLFGTGSALIVSLLAYFWLTRESLLVALTGTGIAIALSASLPYIGYWLAHGDFPETFVWKIAQWSALGLGASTLLSLLVVAGRVYFPEAGLFPSLVVNNLAAGGVLGVLFGSVTELRTRYRTERRLNQRNAVMNRVLRHNIRNDMNTILGYAEAIESGNGAVDDGRPTAVIRRKAERVISLSTTAREIERLAADVEDGPVDLVPLLEGYVDRMRSTRPDAEFVTDLPRSAPAAVDASVEAVIDNLVENALEHNDRPPRVRVSVAVDRPRDGRITVRVADNGPGIPREQLDVILEGEETETRHGNGLGLWLVKWFVEYHDGHLRFEENDPRGSVVVMEFPAADPDRSGDARSEPFRRLIGA